jgi:flagellar hook-associated protein 1
MSDGFGIVASALQAQQTEIGVTSNNIANAQTPGFAVETANMEALPSAGADGVGGGVEVNEISQATNSMLSANNWQAQGALSSLTSLQSVLGTIQNVFPIGQTTSSSGASTTTNTGLAGQLANFWNAWDGIAQDPSGTAPRTDVIDDAQGIATTLQEASTQLSQISANGVTQLSDQVGQVNTLLGQVASLNQQIDTVVGAGANPDSLDDQMTGVLSQLAGLAGVSIQTSSTGTATVNLGGVALVQGPTVNDVALVDTSGTYSLSASGGSGSIPLTVSSGSIAGLLAGLNQYIPEYQGQLNSVASSLASTVNTQLESGYTASGAAGTAMFDGTTAQDLTVDPSIVADPTLIAAATTTGAAAANDGSNAQAMAEFATSQTGADAQYQNIIQSVGSVNETVNTQVSAQQAVATQAQTALSSSTGVDLDTELTDLMSFQANYQASAKVLSVLDDTVQSLLQAVS